MQRKKGWILLFLGHFCDHLGGCVSIHTGLMSGFSFIMKCLHILFQKSPMKSPKTACVSLT